MFKSKNIVGRFYPQWSALAIMLIFIVIQTLTANYGTAINNVPHIANYAVDQGVVSQSSLERRTVVGESLDRESIDLWMMRYKLYSVDADEMVNIMALARVKRDWRKLDPGFYQYGGGWLYPLGAWYFILSKTDVLDLGPLESFLEKPDRMDGVYFWGRLFVILAVAGAAYLIFLTLALLGPPSVALAGMVIFLFAPSTIMYSQLLKPHWYALLWANAAIYLIVRAAKERSWSSRDEIFLGLTVGLTFASTSTYAPFTVLIWCALVFLYREHVLPLRTLLTVPAIAALTWIMTNPHALLHWEAFRYEAAAASAWFNPLLGWESVLDFLFNSGFRGFGFAFLGTAIAVAVIQFIKPQASTARWLGLGIFAIVLFVSWLTENMSAWGINSRYCPYLLSGGLILLALIRSRVWPYVMLGIAALTVFQAAPLIAAYADENRPEHSTRLRMAKWIDANISDGAGLCLSSSTPAPYDAPPIQFNRYLINDQNCPYWVVVERETVGNPPPEGWALMHRVMPRFSPSAYRLVFGHINPQITLYQRSIAAE